MALVAPCLHACVLHSIPTTKGPRKGVVAGVRTYHSAQWAMTTPTEHHSFVVGVLLSPSMHRHLCPIAFYYLSDYCVLTAIAPTEFLGELLVVLLLGLLLLVCVSCFYFHFSCFFLSLFLALPSLVTRNFVSCLIPLLLVTWRGPASPAFGCVQSFGLSA